MAGGPASKNSLAYCFNLFIQSVSSLCLAHSMGCVQSTPKSIEAAYNFPHAPKPEDVHIVVKNPVYQTPPVRCVKAVDDVGSSAATPSSNASVECPNLRMEEHAGVKVQVNRCPFGHGSVVQPWLCTCSALLHDSVMAQPLRLCCMLLYCKLPDPSHCPCASVLACYHQQAVSVDVNPPTAECSCGYYHTTVVPAKDN